jgi:hypothetical protein
MEKVAARRNQIRYSVSPWHTYTRSDHAEIHRFSFSLVMPGSLIRKLASERSNSLSRAPGFKSRKRRVSYPQFPTTHWHAVLPNPAATMARDPERPLYRLLRFRYTPFFRFRPRGKIRVRPLRTPTRMLNRAHPPLLRNFRRHELLL